MPGGKNHLAAAQIALSLKKRDEAKLEMTRKSIIFVLLLLKSALETFFRNSKFSRWIYGKKHVAFSQNAPNLSHQS